MDSGYNYLIKVDTNGNAVLTQLSNNAEKADISLTKVGRDAKGRFTSLKGGVEGVNTSLRGVGTNAEAGFSKLERKAQSSTRVFSKLRSTIAGFGLTLTTGALAAGLVGTGASFEKSMSNVQALSNATKSEMVGLTKAARDAGATTAFTASESADAMGYLALAGYKAKEQIQALPSTLNLAAAGSLGLARSADIATNILSQYRMKAKDTNIVVDQLAFTQSRFNTNIEEAADAMNYFGPTAAALKISLSESNATIGLLANNGLKGSLATRALGTSIVRLTKPTKEMNAVMKNLGLDFFDAKGHFVGMAGMIEQVNAKTQGMTDKQKQGAIATLFGAEAIQEMNILLSEGADKIRYWTGELDNAKGTAQRMADTKLDNLAGDFQILKSTSQEFALSIYDEIGPSLRQITKEATLFVRSMDAKQVGLSLQKTILLLRSGLMWVKDHKNTIIALGKGLLVLKAATLAYSAGMRLSQSITSMATLAKWGYVAATRGAAVATRVFNTAIKANPLGLLLSGLTAVITAVSLFRDRTQEAANAQNNLNQASIESQLIKEESKGLVADTERDFGKLGFKSTSQRQLVQIKESALERKSKAEDMISNLQSKAKSSPEFKEYSELVKKREGTKVVNGVPVYGLTIQEDARLRELKTKINSMPVDQTGLSLAKLTKIVNDNTRLADKAASLIKEKPESSYGNFKGKTSVIDSAPSENIISGGSQQKVINIKVDKLSEIYMDVKGEVDAIKNSISEIRGIVNEQWMRIINSANQM